MTNINIRIKNRIKNTMARITIKIINILIYSLGGKDMINLYVCLIMNDRITMKQVIPRYQTKVKAVLYSIGLDESGDPIEV